MDALDEVIMKLKGVNEKAVKMLKAEAERCPLFLETDAAECEQCPLIIICMERREEVGRESS